MNTVKNANKSLTKGPASKLQNRKNLHIYFIWSEAVVLGVTQRCNLPSKNKGKRHLKDAVRLDNVQVWLISEKAMIFRLMKRRLYKDATEFSTAIFGLNLDQTYLTVQLDHPDLTQRAMS